MPIREYKCVKCKTRFDRIEYNNEKLDWPKCEQCGKRMVREKIYPKDQSHYFNRIAIHNICHVFTQR